MDNHCIDWCLRMLDKAIANYNIEDIKAYTDMLKLWRFK
jgi:hypothetical protein